MPLNRSKELTGGFMAIFVKGLSQQKEVGFLEIGETFFFDDEEDYYIVTSDGPYSLTTGHSFEPSLSTKVTTVHLTLSRVV